MRQVEQPIPTSLTRFRFPVRLSCSSETNKGRQQPRETVVHPRTSYARWKDYLQGVRASAKCLSPKRTMSPHGNMIASAAKKKQPSTTAYVRSPVVSRNKVWLREAAPIQSRYTRRHKRRPAGRSH